MLETQGPFEGVIGFSQGANVAAMLAGIAEYERPGLLPYVVCLCGVESGWARQLPTLLKVPAEPRITLPNLHIHAEKDPYIEGSKRLAALFAKPEVHTHTGDHRPLPADVTEARALTKTIRDFIERVAS